jgi:cell division protein FtsL
MSVSADSIRKTIPGQRPVKERDSRRIRNLLLIVVVGIGVLLPFFTYTWQQIEIIGYGYQIQELKKQERELLEVQKELKIRKAELESLDRIERIARTKLGLADPDPARRFVIVLSKSEEEQGTTAVTAKLP